MPEAIRNRDALRDYVVEETLEAGIILTGGEVKSIRLGKASFHGGYAAVDKRGIYLHGLHIDAYKFSTQAADAYEPVHPRQLLLKTQELSRLRAATQAEGYTIVPLKLYFKKALIKIEIGLGKGKKKFDKRSALKERAVDRESDRLFKYKKR